MEQSTNKPEYDGKPIEHEFDGIRELNNPIPPWLVYLWYITVIFALAYFSIYHIYRMGDLQEAEYEKQMAKAEDVVEQHKEESGQTALTLLTSENDLTAGEAIYKEKLCATCHGQNGEGNAIGPNLTDKYWIHGNTIEDIYTVIYHGVPAKGMTPFKDQLTDEKIVQVGSYVLTRLQGTNPPNGKEPQGELME
jgi:cytochrome c oxidase cbb3-type subunit III